MTLVCPHVYCMSDMHVRWSIRSLLILHLFHWSRNLCDRVHRWRSWWQRSPGCMEDRFASPPTPAASQLLPQSHCRSWARSTCTWAESETKYGESDMNMKDAAGGSEEHTISPDYLYLKKHNSYTRWLLAGFSPLLNLRGRCLHACHFSTLPFPQSHRGCGCRSSHCLYMQVSVCSSLNQPLAK